MYCLQDVRVFESRMGKIALKDLIDRLDSKPQWVDCLKCNATLPSEKDLLAHYKTKHGLDVNDF